jgi:hypothetical protein
MSRLALAFALLSVSVPAFAQDGEPPPVQHDFADADEVVGAVQAPLVERLSSRRRSARGSLVRPRTTFVPELYASVENL